MTGAERLKMLWDRRDPDKVDPNNPFIKQAKDFAIGLPKKDKFGDLRKVNPKELLDFVIQRHHARVAGCFLGFVRISTKTGLMRIDTIVSKKLPVEVLSYNFKTNELEYKKVTNWFINGETWEWKRVICEGDMEVMVTGGHTFYVYDGNGAIVEKKVKDLVHNDKLVLVNPESGFIEPIKCLELKDEPTYKLMYKYDIEVEDNHNYFANSLLVSNSHYDLRAGDKARGLYSWVTRKVLPEEGKSVGVFRTNTHRYEYKDFEGIIPPGYGAGPVSKVKDGKILITKRDNNDIHFTTADTSIPKRYALIHPKDRSWKRALLIRGRAPVNTGVEKPDFKPVDKEVVEYLKTLGPDDVVQPKIDGALALIHLLKNKNLEILSHRVSKRTGTPVVQTERVLHHRPEHTAPKEFNNSVLLGELYGTRDGKVIPQQELGGLLNSNIGKSIENQNKDKVNLKVMLFDIARKGKRLTSDVSYEDRLDILKELIKHLPEKEKFELPETVKGPEKAIALLAKIKARQHPLTQEGLVVRPKDGNPLKAKLFKEHDVYIKGVFEGEGKYKGKAAGGFEYSLTPDGPVVGKVGTGLDDNTRKMLLEDPNKFIGRVARISSQGQFPITKAHRAPSLIALEENK